MPLGFARATPAAVHAKLSICMIIWFTINVFTATEEIRTETGQELGARPLHHGARPVPGPSVGPLPRASFLMQTLLENIYVAQKHQIEKVGL